MSHVMVVNNYQSPFIGPKKIDPPLDTGSPVDQGIDLVEPGS